MRVWLQPECITVTVSESKTLGYETGYLILHTGYNLVKHYCVVPKYMYMLEV